MPGIWSWYGESHRQRKYPGQGYFMMHRLFVRLLLKFYLPILEQFWVRECGYCGLNIQKRSWCMSSVFCSGKILLRQLNFERLAVRVTVEWYSLIFESHIDPSTLLVSPRPLITAHQPVRIVSDLFRPTSRDPGVIAGNWPTRHLSPHPGLSQLQQPSNIIIYVSLFTNLTSPLPSLLPGRCRPHPLHHTLY